MQQWLGILVVINRFSLPHCHWSHPPNIPHPRNHGFLTGDVCPGVRLSMEKTGVWLAPCSLARCHFRGDGKVICCWGFVATCFRCPGSIQTFLCQIRHSWRDVLWWIISRVGWLYQSHWQLALRCTMVSELTGDHNLFISPNSWITSLVSSPSSNSNIRDHRDHHPQVHNRTKKL